ncbi:MAG: tetratricopeptide repeat protein [Bernardetiaceae bacterium]|nr:tetratricopeptide repeat protein [Bernardetiaceae bacterium]
MRLLIWAGWLLAPWAALAQPDTAAVNRLNRQARELRHRDAAASLARAREARQAARQIGYQPGLAEALAHLGVAFRNQNQYDSALACLFQALRLNEQLQNPQGQTANLNSLGSVLYYQQNLPQAREFYERALQLATQTNDRAGQAASLMGLGVAHSAEPEVALAHYLRAADLYQQAGHPAERAQNLNNLGNVYRAKGETAKALDYLQQALALNRQLGNYASEITNLNNLGEVYLQQGNLAQAEVHFRQAVQTAISANLKLATAQSYRRLVELFRAKKQFEPALEYLDKAVELEKSIYNDEKSRQVQELQTIYATERQAQENAALQAAHQRQQWFTATGVALALLLAGLLFVAVRNQRKLRLAQQRTDQLLHNILPEEVAEELKTEGRATPRLYERVTVLFTDLRGFTQLAETLTPGQLVEVLEACFSAFDQIIAEHNLEKIKTLGDGYLCAGGIPVPNMTNPLDAVRAGLAMQTFMRQWNAERLAAGQPTLELRVGIHTGRVVAGVVGRNKFAYDIWGDTVNIASRMESSGEPGRVNLSGETYQLVKGYFVCTHRGRVQAKNKGEIDMYFVEDGLLG